MEQWTVSRSRARANLGWHIQARTADQLCSFVAIVGEGASYLRTKASDGKSDIFTLTDPATMATMNIVGKIKYVQDWDGV